MTTLLSNGTSFNVKWACANLPFIDFGNNVAKSTRIFLTKTDIVKIIDELQEFVAFYSDDFSPDQIAWTIDADINDTMLMNGEYDDTMG